MDVLSGVLYPVYNLTDGRRSTDLPNGVHHRALQRAQDRFRAVGIRPENVRVHVPKRLAVEFLGVKHFQKKLPKGLTLQQVQRYNCQRTWQIKELVANAA